MAHRIICSTVSDIEEIIELNSFHKWNCQLLHRLFLYLSIWCTQFFFMFCKHSLLIFSLALFTIFFVAFANCHPLSFKIIKFYRPLYYPIFRSHFSSYYNSILLQLLFRYVFGLASLHLPHFFLFPHSTILNYAI